VVNRAVMSGADANEIFQRVASTFGAQLDVMYIDPAGVAAAGHLAAALIAQKDGAAQGGRDGLPGPRECARSARRSVRLRGAARISLDGRSLLEGGG